MGITEETQRTLRNILKMALCDADKNGEYYIVDQITEAANELNLEL